MEIAESLLELVGNTPLVKLHRIAREMPCPIVVKLETTNPGGNVKDRIAIEMIDAAERDGSLKPGGTIIEPTSGNTGIGLAIVAAQRGYRCIFVVTDKVSSEKVDLLRAYGSEVVICPVAVAPEDPASYYSTAKRLVEEIPGAFRPDQYSNPNNPLAHEKTTGPEIWRQTDGKVTHFVAGIGTGGTISGVARYLKSQNANIKIIGADPEGSVFSGGEGRPYLVEGVGEDFWPETYDPTLVDRTIAISDRDAFLTARQVTQEEGLLVGGSGGLVVAGALALGPELTPEDLVVALIPDSGRGYLSKVFNDDWMYNNGFLSSESPTIGEVIATKLDQDTFYYVNPEDTMRRAITLMHDYNISQLPVVKNKPPFSAAEVIGSVDELALMNRSFLNPESLDRPVEEIMSEPLPTIGVGQGLARAVELLENSNALLLLDSGRPTAILSRSDVLEYFSETTEGTT